MALQVTSVLASAGTSFIRVRKFIKVANAEVFGPRGLVVKIQTTKEMMASVGLTKTGQKGKLGLPPLETVVDLKAYSSTPLVNGMNSESTAVVSPLEDPRLLRLRALDGHIAPLTFEVPNQPPEGAFSRYSKAPLRWVNKRRSNRLRKAEVKYHKKREGKVSVVAAETSKFDVIIKDIDRQIEMLQCEDASCVEGAWETQDEIEAQSMRKQDEITALNMRKQEEVDKRDVKVKELHKGIDKKMDKAYKKEEKAANRILWIVIDRIGEGERD